jgi:hypothetical protein
MKISHMELATKTIAERTSLRNEWDNLKANKLHCGVEIELARLPIDSRVRQAMIQLQIDDLYKQIQEKTAKLRTMGLTEN